MEDSLEKEKLEEGSTFDYLLEEGAWDHVHVGISLWSWSGLLGWRK